MTGICEKTVKPIATSESLCGALLTTLLPSSMVTGDEAARLAQWAPGLASTYCRRCGASVGPGGATENGCAHCIDDKVPWDGVWRLDAYADPMAGWVRQMKFARAWMWGYWLGGCLAHVVPDDARALVVPVPLHWTRRLRRGYDQAAMMAEGLARAKGWRMARPLKRVRRTKAQSRLHTQQARRDNVRRSFAARPTDLDGWCVWLVDDVKTSGATAGQCIKLLRRLGAARVNLAVAAVADAKRADFQVS